MMNCRSPTMIEVKSRPARLVIKRPQVSYVKWSNLRRQLAHSIQEDHEPTGFLSSSDLAPKQLNGLALGSTENNILPPMLCHDPGHCLKLKGGSVSGSRSSCENRNEWRPISATSSSQIVYSSCELAASKEDSKTEELQDKGKLKVSKDQVSKRQMKSLKSTRQEQIHRASIQMVKSLDSRLTNHHHHAFAKYKPHVKIKLLQCQSVEQRQQYQPPFVSKFAKLASDHLTSFQNCDDLKSERVLCEFGAAKLDQHWSAILPQIIIMNDGGCFVSQSQAPSRNQQKWLELFSSNETWRRMIDAGARRRPFIVCRASTSKRLMLQSSSHYLQLGDVLVSNTKRWPDKTTLAGIESDKMACQKAASFRATCSSWSSFGLAAKLMVLCLLVQPHVVVVVDKFNPRLGCSVDERAQIGQPSLSEWQANSRFVIKFRPKSGETDAISESVLAVAVMVYQSPPNVSPISGSGLWLDLKPREWLSELTRRRPRNSARQLWQARLARPLACQMNWPQSRQRANNSRLPCRLALVFRLKSACQTNERARGQTNNLDGCGMAAGASVSAIAESQWQARSKSWLACQACLCLGLATKTRTINQDARRDYSKGEQEEEEEEEDDYEKQQHEHWTIRKDRSLDLFVSVSKRHLDGTQTRSDFYVGLSLLCQLFWLMLLFSSTLRPLPWTKQQLKNDDDDGFLLAATNSSSRRRRRHYYSRLEKARRKRIALRRHSASDVTSMASILIVSLFCLFAMISSSFFLFPAKMLMARATPTRINSRNLSRASNEPMEDGAGLIRMMNEQFSAVDSSLHLTKTRFLEFGGNPAEYPLKQINRSSRVRLKPRMSSNEEKEFKVVNNSKNDLKVLPQTNSNDFAYEQLQLMPSTASEAPIAEQQLHYKWPVVSLVSFMFIGASGNILVCLAIWRERRLQTATNYFLLSLAVADLLVCVLVMPFGIIYEFYGYWPFDWRICNLWVTCDVLTCSSSILHMCFISVGRYLGIRNPLHARQANLFVSRRAVLWRIAIAWASSALIASPITMMSLYDHKNIMPRPRECAISNKYFMIFGSLIAFFIPMFVMVPSYIMTIRLLSRRAKFVRNDSLLLQTASDNDRRRRQSSSTNQLEGNENKSNHTNRTRQTHAGSLSQQQHQPKQQQQTMSLGAGETGDEDESTELSDRLREGRNQLKLHSSNSDNSLTESILQPASHSGPNSELAMRDRLSSSDALITSGQASYAAQAPGSADLKSANFGPQASQISQLNGNTLKDFIDDVIDEDHAMGLSLSPKVLNQVKRSSLSKQTNCQQLNRPPITNLTNSIASNGVSKLDSRIEESSWNQNSDNNQRTTTSPELHQQQQFLSSSSSNSFIVRPPKSLQLISNNCIVAVTKNLVDQQDQLGSSKVESIVRNVPSDQICISCIDINSSAIIQTDVEKLFPLSVDQRMSDQQQKQQHLNLNNQQQQQQQARGQQSLNAANLQIESVGSISNSRSGNEFSNVNGSSAKVKLDKRATKRAIGSGDCHFCSLGALDSKKWPKACICCGLSLSNNNNNNSDLIESSQVEHHREQRPPIRVIPESNHIASDWHRAKENHHHESSSFNAKHMRLAEQEESFAVCGPAGMLQSSKRSLNDDRSIQNRQRQLFSHSDQQKITMQSRPCCCRCRCCRARCGHRRHPGGLAAQSTKFRQQPQMGVDGGCLQPQANNKRGLGHECEHERAPPSSSKSLAAALAGRLSIPGDISGQPAGSTATNINANEQANSVSILIVPDDDDDDDGGAGAGAGAGDDDSDDDDGSGNARCDLATPRSREAHESGENKHDQQGAIDNLTTKTRASQELPKQRKVDSRASSAKLVSAEPQEDTNNEQLDGGNQLILPCWTIATSITKSANCKEICSYCRKLNELRSARRELSETVLTTNKIETMSRNKDKAIVCGQKDGGKLKSMNEQDQNNTNKATKKLELDHLATCERSSQGHRHHKCSAHRRKALQRLHCLKHSPGAVSGHCYGHCSGSGGGNGDGDGDGGSGVPLKHHKHHHHCHNHRRHHHHRKYCSKLHGERAVLLSVDKTKASCVSASKGQPRAIALTSDDNKETHFSLSTNKTHFSCSSLHSHEPPVSLTRLELHANTQDSESRTSQTRLADQSATMITGNKGNCNSMNNQANIVVPKTSADSKVIGRTDSKQNNWKETKTKLDDTTTACRNSSASSTSNSNSNTNDQQRPVLGLLQNSKAKRLLGQSRAKWHQRSSSSTRSDTDGKQQQSTSNNLSEPQMIRYLGSSMQVRGEQKATKVLGLVFFIFVICWTPFFVLNFTQGFVRREVLARYISDNIMTIFLWLGYISSTINPVIYTVFNRNFRRAFRQLLLCRAPVRRGIRRADGTMRNTITTNTNNLQFNQINNRNYSRGSEHFKIGFKSASQYHQINNLNHQSIENNANNGNVEEKH